MLTVNITIHSYEHHYPVAMAICALEDLIKHVRAEVPLRKEEYGKIPDDVEFEDIHTCLKATFLVEE